MLFDSVMILWLAIFTGLVLRHVTRPEPVYIMPFPIGYKFVTRGGYEAEIISYISTQLG
jgi:hypothetical protein